jgi:hypothetical protein
MAKRDHHRQLPDPVRYWTATEDEMVVAHHMTNAELARQIDRTVYAVSQRRMVLKGTSSKPRWGAVGFPTMPRGHTGWLIAKTCPQCGAFLPASAFEVKRDGGRRHICAPCQSDVFLERYRADEQFRAQTNANALRHHAKSQISTIDRAHHAGMEWTGPELEIVMREDLTRPQKAEMLGRTHYAISQMIWKIQSGDPKKVRLAGLRRADPA